MWLSLVIALHVLQMVAAFPLNMINNRPIIGKILIFLYIPQSISYYN